jgi:hypothetical protein
VALQQSATSALLTSDGATAPPSGWRRLYNCGQTMELTPSDEEEFAEATRTSGTREAEVKVVACTPVHTLRDC